MTEEKFSNAINEFLFLTNSANSLISNHLSMEIYEPQEANITPKMVTETDSSQGTSNENCNQKEIQHADSIFTPPLSEESKNTSPTITPAIMKREFLTCTKCPLASEHRVLGEGVQIHPDVIVVTDTVLDDQERAYLDTILKTIHLNPEINTYITSLIKCESKNTPTKNCYQECSKFLNMQFSLYRPLAAIGFGIEASNFLRELKNSDDYKMCAFIFTRMPFDLKNNIEAKKKVWESFKKLAVFLKLPRI